MSKRVFILANLLIIIITIFPLVSVTHSPELDVYTDIEKKLGPYLIQEQSQSTETHQFDVIVACDWELAGPDYLQKAQSEVSFTVLKNWKGLRMFRANLTTSQISNLANFPFVLRIDNNTLNIGSVCMDAARLHTYVADLRDDYPNLDGNKDSVNDYTEDDIVIAVLDTGIDEQHMDLDDDKVIGWHDVVNDQPDPYDDHDYEGSKGHGTHCSSIAAGSGDADWSYRGVAPYAALVGVKMIDFTGYYDIEDALDALDWVAQHHSQYGIEIVSCSWGGGYFGDYDSQAIAVDNLVRYHDLVVCVGAGNYGKYGEGYITPPGTAKYAITVGSADDPGEGGWQWSSYSSQGPCDDGRIKPDILAPGYKINAALVGTTNEYQEMNGTSMATPFVAGLAALFLDYEYSLRYNDGSHRHPDAKLLMMASAVDMPDDNKPGKDNKFGSGRIDAWAMKYFYDKDISDYFDDAPIVLSYQWEGYYSRPNEPLWRGEVDASTDFYKLRAYAGMYISALAIGDHDLKLRVYLYDKYRNVITMSSWGRVKSVSHLATYKGVYYARVWVYCGDYYDLSGDYYDMYISTVGI